MKKMFRIALPILCCLLALACSKQKTGSADSKTAQPEGKTVSIGIAKIVQHEALDASERGVQDQLKTRGFNATYDLQNANGDLTTASQIANKFKSEKVDAIVGIATPMAVALANTMKDIPIVFTAVTDPVSAKLVTTLDHGEGNVTGVSDAVPIVDQIGLFKQIAGIKTLGFIYTSSEANSIAALAQVQEGCQKYGLTLVTQTINTSADLRQATQAIINRVDGIYASTDNTVISAFPAMIQVCHDAKKPIFGGDPSSAFNGGCVIANGINYYKGGLAAGDMVADILEGKSPADIPVKVFAPIEMDLLFDLDEAANCGIAIPQDLIDRATYIYQDGKLTTK
ncbi:MAG: ABC transporter substrate-binding protein [Treponema sp.]|nr:ABC transporter substrate-binding protein [Treponema sp.]